MKKKQLRRRNKSFHASRQQRRDEWIEAKLLLLKIEIKEGNCDWLSRAHIDCAHHAYSEWIETGESIYQFATWTNIHAAWDRILEIEGKSQFSATFNTVGNG